MIDQFRSIGVSYKEVNIDDRSVLALSANQAQEYLYHTKESFPVSELLVISTCNRTEVFYSSQKDLSSELFGALFTSRGLLIPEQTIPNIVILKKEKAVERLFRISLGLESKVIGDLQIINQIKKAYQQCADLELAGPFLHRLMHGVFFTNKKVVQESSFRDGAASSSYAAYEIVKELSASVVEPKILVLGLGEIGTDVARHLSDHEVPNVTLMNRTDTKAQELAFELKVDYALFQNLPVMVNSHDVIISSVAASSPILTLDLFKGKDKFEFKYIVDLSVPRSTEPKVGMIDGISLFTIDDIENKTSIALERRKQAIPQVEGMVAEALKEFYQWSTELEVSPTIQKLKSALEQIRKEEIAKYLGKMDDGQAEMVELVTKSMLQKIIKLPVLELKAACKRGEAETLIDALSHIFNLEDKVNV